MMQFDACQRIHIIPVPRQSAETVQLATVTDTSYKGRMKGGFLEDGQAGSAHLITGLPYEGGIMPKSIEFGV